MALWKYRGTGGGKRKGRKRTRRRPRKYTGAVRHSGTVVPGGTIPRSIVTSKIGCGEFTRRVPI